MQSCPKFVLGCVNLNGRITQPKTKFLGYVYSRRVYLVGLNFSSELKWVVLISLASLFQKSYKREHLIIKWILRITHMNKDGEVDFSDWVQDGKVLSK